MLIKKHDVRIEERVNLMGGINSVFTSWLLEIPMFKGAGRVFHRIVIPPMCSIGYHVHRGDSEAYYMYEGSGILNDNGTEREFKPGDLVFTAENTGHGFYNNTDKNAIIIACVLFNLTGKEDITELRKFKPAGTLTKVEMHEPFGGKGDPYAYKLMEGEELTDAGRLYNLVTFPPNTSIGYHEHVGESETYYILKGKGIFNDDGVEKEVEAGDVLYTGPGHSHGLANAGDEDLQIVALICYDVENK